MPIKRNMTKMPKKTKKKAKPKPRRRQPKLRMENKSTSTNGILDNFIFHVWEGKHHYKTIQGEIPQDILKMNEQLEETVKNLTSSCQYCLPKIYLILSLIALLSISIYACIEGNWYVLNGSAVVFFLSNILFFNSFGFDAKKFENLFKGKIKNMSQSGILGRFVVDWRVDFRRRRARRGELGGLVNELRVELQLIKREIRREESLFAPSASKLLKLDDNNLESDDVSDLALGDIEEEKCQEANNLGILEFPEEKQLVNKSTKRTKRKMYGEDEGEDDDNKDCGEVNLSVPNDEAWALSHEPEVVSVRINGQDLVCFPQRYRIRRPHHPDFNTYKDTGDDNDDIFPQNS